MAESIEIHNDRQSFMYMFDDVNERNIYLTPVERAMLKLLKDISDKLEDVKELLDENAS